MKRASMLSVWWTGSALLAALAVGAYVYSLDVRQEARATIRALREDLGALAELEAAVRDAESVQSRVTEAAHQHRGAGVAAVLECLPKGLEPSSRSHAVESLNPDWSIRRVELAFANAPLALVEQFVHRVEGLPAPWRLHEIDIRARDGEGAVGDVALQFESLLPAGSE